MKEPDYMMKLISRHSGLTMKKGKKEPKTMYKDNNGATNTTTFRYTEPF